MLGRDLTPVLGASHHVVPLNRTGADVTNAAAVRHTLAAAQPDTVIHLAAMTAVDECERERETAFQVNGQGTHNVAAACRDLRIPLMYISTDYVFDGSKPSPYVENDDPHPINAYGESKLEGERSVMETLDRFWIVRVSWLFGPMGKNFVRTILDRARGGAALRVVNDQVGAPTYTADLSQKIGEMIQKNCPPGIYHVTNQGYCSWFEFAREALRQSELDGVALAPISSAESARLARRPKNSRLANARLASEGLSLLPTWQDALARYLARAQSV